MRNKIGRFAVCGAGRIGKIEGVDRRGFFGIGIDGKSWVSRTPRFIKQSQEQFLHDNNAKSAGSMLQGVDTSASIFNPFNDGSSLNR